MSLEHFDAGAVLGRLKDFQRRTVDHVFHRMWVEDPPSPRFLVADEVGLGKTLVARGIIAKTIEHLRDGVERIDVVYVCSNAAIAQQNVNRLNVLEDGEFAVASRLTLLPLQLHEFEKKRVNLVSFTPGTTFNLRSSGGRYTERVILLRILTSAYPELARPLLHLLRAGVRLDRFERYVRWQEAPLNESLGRRFLDAVRKDPDLLEELAELCVRFRDPRTEVPREDRSRQFALIGRLRQLLAGVCIDALEPDLVILDEFQRFRGLLDGDDEAARLARDLMDYTAPEGHRVRVLLLSATPYKPLTLAGEEENHYQDFLRTVGFLFEGAARAKEDGAAAPEGAGAPAAGPAPLARLEEHLRTYRRGLYGVGDPALADGMRQDLERARKGVEGLLRSVMVRTERVSHTAERDAMLETRRTTATLEPRDLDHARLVSRVGEAVGAWDQVEYWKSAPYLLHFMKDYQLRRKLEKVAEAPPPELGRALADGRDLLLSEDRVQRYEPIEPGNGRLRCLIDEMVEPGQWRLLWTHPSLPYYEPGGAYAEVRDFTKALVFSSWNVVPDAVAAVCSYEVERRMMGAGGELPPYRALYQVRRPLLRFSESGGRLVGMPTLALMYPSVALARAVDPLHLVLQAGGGAPASLADVRRGAAVAVERLLRETGLWPRTGEGRADERWYWAALAILDRPHLTGLRWWMSGRGWREALAGGEEDGGLRKHIEWFREAAEGSLDEELGPAPADLVEVLVDFALGSPAICARRALLRITASPSPSAEAVSNAAARVASGFRTLFNLPQTITLLRGRDEDVYWHHVLRHGIEGNLQAVLDEYAHQLRESLGLADHGDRAILEGVSEAMAEALSFRTARIGWDQLVHAEEEALEFDRYWFRTRFALRFGELRDDRDQTLTRVGTVRAAFNSPFRPFVLATTSIGQEGLDFHPYCHAVYHWNLPSNPVDMEQREGRVHRYKGHAVRKNVAARWGLPAVAQRLEHTRDPWAALFDAAADAREAHQNDLVPFWIYPGPARVERQVPLFPFSLETGRILRLQRGLAVYRLAFGQPRQEDLVTFLTGAGGDGERDQADLRISLEPEGG